MDKLLFIDFETYWDTTSGYSLGNKKMSMVEYVRDPRFKVFGAGIALGDENPRWLSGLDFTEVMFTGKWSDVIVVGHNIKFDGFILSEKYGVQPKGWIDTKGMSRAVLGKTIRNHSLATLANYFVLPSKGIMKTDGLKELTVEQEAELAEYCLHDVWLCREIYKKLAKEFPESQYLVMDQTVKMFVNPKLELNVPLLESASKEEALRRETIFNDIKIDKKEFASNKKFPELLKSKSFDVPMKPSPRQKNEDGSPKLIPAIALGDPEFLEMLEGENDELRTLCEARQAAKSTLLETRTGKLAALGRTGNWPFDVEFSGADQTHRFSGGSGSGGNPQNFTRGSALRKAVQAPVGHKLVVGDFSNIEFRLVAYLSKDPGLIEAIEKGIDIYCDFASVFFGRTITKKDEMERKFGKTAILGLGYGMGWKKFKKTVRIQTGQTISDEDAKRAVDLYRNRYTQVPALWEYLDRHISNINSPVWLKNHLPITIGNESIRLPSGLKIRFPNLRQEVGKRNKLEWKYDVYSKGKLETRSLYGGKVLENICQGLAGELCKLAMLEMGDDVVGQVHDELHLIVPEDQVDLAATKLEEVMSQSPSWMPEMKLQAEVGIGNNWLESK